MSYLVTCTFDLKDASSQDYLNAYAALDALGLRKVIVSDNGIQRIVPTTMTIGQFTGQSAAAVQDWVLAAVKQAFAVRGLAAEIFVVVGSDWAWGASTTAATFSVAR